MHKAELAIEVASRKEEAASASDLMSCKANTTFTACIQVSKQQNQLEEQQAELMRLQKARERKPVHWRRLMIPLMLDLMLSQALADAEKRQEELALQGGSEVRRLQARTSS